MQIISFGASTSTHSINRSFAAFTALQFENAGCEVLDLNDYSLPMFSVDVEKENGIPAAVYRFIEKLQQADLIVISMAEHNGSYTAAFKNLMDWSSRVELKFFAEKPILLLSTSPGGRGGKGVLEQALVRFPKHGARIIASFSLPGFKEHFIPGQGIIHPELNAAFQLELQKVKKEFFSIPHTS